MAPTRLLQFIQLLPKVPADGDFLLKDLPGSGGRVDLLCRDLAACFDWGPESWPKDGLELLAVIANKIVLIFRDPKEKLPVGERAWAEVIQQSLRGNPPSYITIEESSIEQIVGEIIDRPDSKIWVLDEGGDPLSEKRLWECHTQNSFMLGDHVGFDSRAQMAIRKFDVPRVSLGATSYLSSHCIVNVISASERES
ncbi:MAG: hypothetical protein K9W43_02270 [Candidatus Thorarchaeota archaeon]|nr:hypothetical protein [Candidatus Thorarchaeota archaeon]